MGPLYLGNSGASSDPSQDMTNAPRTKEAITTVVNRQDLTVYELCSVGINNEEAHIIVTSRCTLIIAEHQLGQGYRPKIRNARITEALHRFIQAVNFTGSCTKQEDGSCTKHHGVLQVGKAQQSKNPRRNQKFER